MADLLYLDASALVKLVVDEPQSGALAAEIEHWPKLVTSEIADVELHRAAKRTDQEPTRAAAVVARLSLLALDAPRKELARRVGSPALRSLLSLIHI